MKFKTLTVAVLGCLFAASASANTSYIVNVNDSSMIEDNAWVIDYEQISDSYAKVSVSDEQIAIAESYFFNSGYYYELNVMFSHPKTESTQNPYNQTVSEQAATLNDPLLSSQESFLSDDYKIIEGILSKRDSKKTVNVLILDSGSLVHEDVVFSGGYNYADIFVNENRDPNDYGDYTEFVDETGGVIDTCGDSHGLVMAGLIGAKQNNGIGISGVSNAKMYMARVVEKDCNSNENVGSTSSILKALEDASNSSNQMGAPAFDVVNMSLASRTPCTAPLQAAINKLHDSGVTIVSAAGNQGDLASAYSPGNCENVINVGAIDNNVAASYSNSGSGIDILSPGSNLSTSPLGYDVTIGTSGAAAVVTGIVATIRSQFPDITPDQIKKMLEISSSPLSFEICGDGCGSGSVNLKEALVAAEKIIDPKISFSHAFNDDTQCLVTRESEALSSQLDVCGAMLGKISTSYIEGENPVSYNFEVLRRTEGQSSWFTPQVTKLYDYSPTMNKDELPIQNADFSNYEYGIASCYTSTIGEKFCPYVEELDGSEISYPSNCG